MISVDLAPNENFDDALLSLKLIFKPWQWVKGKEINKAKRILLSSFLNIKDTKNFQVYFFLTGRAALFTILKTLNLPKDSEVITQGFTCEAVILPILANNLKPNYIDINPTTFSLNPIDLEKKINKNCQVLILQHTFAIPPSQLEKIYNLVKKHNLLLIQDIAHGYSIYQNKNKLTNQTYILSFGRSKALSSVFGGAIITNNKFLIKKLNKEIEKLKYPSIFFIFRCLLYKPLYFFIKKTYDFLHGKIIHYFVDKFFKIVPKEISNKEKEGNYDFSFNKKYPNALAILLLNQLKKYKNFYNKRVKITNFYQDFFKKNHYRNLPLLKYPILVKNRDQLIIKALKQNIFFSQWYNQVVAPKTLNLKKVYYKLGSCPVSEKLSQQIINLPTNISYLEAKKVIKILNDV